MQVDFYSDIGCVWCYISMHRLERALAAYPHRDDVEVVHRPFQLDPSLPHAPKPHLEFLDGLFGNDAATEVVQRVTRITGRDGIPYNPRTALSVNTLQAHRLLRLAGLEYGLKAQADLKMRMYTARFAEGGNVNDPSELTDMAVAAGLDGSRVKAFLATDEGTTEIRDQVAQARRFGVTAVPTFAIDGALTMSGAQETSTFLRAMEQAAAKTASSVGQVEQAADGVC